MSYLYCIRAVCLPGKGWLPAEHYGYSLNAVSTHKDLWVLMQNCDNSWKTISTHGEVWSHVENCVSPWRTVSCHAWPKPHLHWVLVHLRGAQSHAPKVQWAARRRATAMAWSAFPDQSASHPPCGWALHMGESSGNYFWYCLTSVPTTSSLACLLIFLWWCISLGAFLTKSMFSLRHEMDACAHAQRGRQTSCYIIFTALQRKDRHEVHSTGASSASL